MLLHVFHALDAVSIRQAHVRQAQTERDIAIQHEHGFLQILRAPAFEVHSLKGDFKQFTNIGFIVYH